MVMTLPLSRVTVTGPFCGNRGTVLVGQGRGVGDGAVFVDARGGGQGHRSGVVDIVDRGFHRGLDRVDRFEVCLLYTSPSPRDLSTSRMPSSA